MATTTNYGWTTPDDTALVKDGASAIRSLGTSIDTTTKNLNPSTTLGDLEYRSSTANTNTRIPIGTSGQGLQVVAGVPAWAASSTSTLTTTGDLLYASAANTLARRGIGTTGQVLTVSGGLPTWATPSGSTITWTQRLQSVGYEFNTIAYNGSNLYVAAGTGGTLYSSSDGITWTSRTSGFGANDINKLHYASGLSLWIAVGGNGTLTTSSDGITWTARTANMSTNTLYDVFSNGTDVVAVGTGGGATNTGGITYSTNGTTWTRKSQTPTVGTTYYGVTYNGTNWVICANVSTNNALYSSTPSGTYTAVVVGAGILYAVIWDGTRHIFLRDNAALYTTTSTTLASVVTISNGLGFVTVNPGSGYLSLYNGRIYYSAFAASQTLSILGDFSTTISANSSTMFSSYKSDAAPVPMYGAYGYFVGAIGRILATAQGLYTSF